jgi:hypothetical protein
MLTTPDGSHGSSRRVDVGRAPDMREEDLVLEADSKDSRVDPSVLTPFNGRGRRVLPGHHAMRHGASLGVNSLFVGVLGYLVHIDAKEGSQVNAEPVNPLREPSIAHLDPGGGDDADVKEVVVVDKVPSEVVDAPVELLCRAAAHELAVGEEVENLAPELAIRVCLGPLVNVLTEGKVGLLPVVRGPDALVRGNNNDGALL